MEEVKRIFLRACINRGVIDKESATKILESICEKYKVNAPELPQLITSINEEIAQFDQVLMIQKYPLNREEYIIFGNTHGLPDTKVHPTLKDEERRYFAILLEALSNGKKYCIKWHEAFALKNDPGTKVVPMIRKQELMEQWKEQGYLYDVNDYITFGPKMLVEFDFHFRTNYREQIKGCPLCKKLTYWDIECSSCKVKIHYDCIRSYLRLRSNCPKCRVPWETPVKETPVNETM